MKRMTTEQLEQKSLVNSDENSTITPSLREKFNSTGYYSLVAIAIRKAMEGSVAIASSIKHSFGSFLNTMNPNTTKLLSTVFLPVQMSIYGFYTLWSTIHTGIKLKSLWTDTGAYSAEAQAKKGKGIKPLHAKIKTTLFAGGMNASDISCFILSCIMLTSTSITIASPVTIALLAINGAINFAHYGIWSPIQRTVELYRNLQTHRDNPEQLSYAKKLYAVQMMSNIAKFTMGVMMAGGIAALLILAQPAATIAASAIFVSWVVAKLVYAKLIKPRFIDPKTIEYRRNMNGESCVTDTLHSDANVTMKSEPTYRVLTTKMPETNPVVIEGADLTPIVDGNTAAHAMPGKGSFFENRPSIIDGLVAPSADARPEC